MGFAKIRGQLKSRIGQRVTYSAPKDVREKGGGPAFGMIVDEVWADSAENEAPPRKAEGEHDWGDYSFFAQLIRWDEDADAAKEGYSIRLGYYRRRCGEDWWEFAGQTTVSSKWPTIKALCEKTLAKTWWFQNSPVQRFPRKKEQERSPQVSE